jgi:hypothetical protein
MRSGMGSPRRCRRRPKLPGYFFVSHPPHGPYYNHQCHEQGRNVSRYVPTDQVPALQEAIEGYHRFERLMGQYVQLMVDQTRAERQADSKKKPPRPSSSSPRKRKSSN